MHVVQWHLVPNWNVVVDFQASVEVREQAVRWSMTASLPLWAHQGNADQQERLLPLPPGVYVRDDVAAGDT